MVTFPHREDVLPRDQLLVVGLWEDLWLLGWQLLRTAASLVVAAFLAGLVVRGRSSVFDQDVDDLVLLDAEGVDVDVLDRGDLTV